MSGGRGRRKGIITGVKFYNRGYVLRLGVSSYVFISPHDTHNAHHILDLIKRSPVAPLGFLIKVTGQNDYHHGTQYPNLFRADTV